MRAAITVTGGTVVPLPASYRSLGRRVASPAWPAKPQLATLAGLSARLPRRAGDAIEILLAAARPFDDGFQPLRPFWAQEVVHRGLSMLRLFAALQRLGRGRLVRRSIHERRLAMHLAAELASLETRDLTCIRPCSGPLREIARDLVALFGPASGDIVLDTDVMPLGMPAYKRRALVLLGHELVANALTHAFDGRSVGHLSIRLHRVGAGYARLQVEDDGVGFTPGCPRPDASVAGGLAELLEGDLRYIARRGSGSMPEVVFPAW